MSKLSHELILDIHPIKQVPEVAEIIMFKDVDYMPAMVVRFSDGVTAEVTLELTFDYEF